MLSSPHTSDFILDDEHSHDGLTPVVPSFTGLASHSVPLESLERYKLVARLGHGGMAEVFLAAWEVEPFVHRPVVIKRLHTHFDEDPRLVQMFLDEARLLCLLEHPHVVKTLEAGVIDGKCCIAMEYLEGQPLHRVLRRAYERGRLPIEAAVSIAISVLEGLSYAHEATDASGQSLELVHRDISPQNVFVTNDGQVKVLDFGIAKARTHEGRTATGVVKGKLGYIAPEQAAGESVDRRADIWSLGVLLWEALTGSRLFKGETDAGTLNQSLRGEIPSAASRRPELPVELDVVLARALQRNPSLRYRTAAAMHRDLQSWQRSYGNAAGRVALGDLMRELFSAELLEQRRMVSVLMARSDCTAPPPISTRSPSSTSALIVRNHSSAPAEMSDLSRQMLAMGKRHGRALRAITAGLAVLAALGSAAAYFAVARLERSAAHVPARILELAARPVAARVAAGTGLAAGPEQATNPPPSPAPVAQAAALLPHATAPLKRAAVAARVAPEKPSTEPTAASAPLLSAKPEPSAIGFLTIDTSPWSQVSVAGRPLGQTPLVGVKLPSGSQVLTLRNPELGIETSYTVQIDAGKTTIRRIGIE